MTLQLLLWHLNHLILGIANCHGIGGRARAVALTRALRSSMRHGMGHGMRAGLGHSDDLKILQRIWISDFLFFILCIGNLFITDSIQVQEGVRVLVTITLPVA